MSAKDSVFIRHILESANLAGEFVAGRTRDDLESDEMLALALVRLLEIIGEASRNISESTRADSPDIPWQQMAATRNRLIHGYFDVDLDIVWAIVTVDLPPLIVQLHTVIADSP